MINVFEQADFRNYADIVRNIITCEDEHEADDYSDYDEPIPQPETYARVTLNPPSLPDKISKHISSVDEYFMINPTTAKDLPEGEKHIYII